MRLSVQNLGPIAEADVTFGDLTILVGPQATGKSIFLQTLKLVQDCALIKAALNNQGYVWSLSGFPDDFLELVYGEGAEIIWHANSEVKLNGKKFSIKTALKSDAGQFNEQAWNAVYIPAQRSLALANGWVRPFEGYELATPYVLKEFSDALRLNLQMGLFDDDFKSKKLNLSRQISRSVEKLINSLIYQDGEIFIDNHQLRRRITMKVRDASVPVMNWSTGQREFLPLMLTLYMILNRRPRPPYIIIEEPEMGLHPKAIQAFLLLVLELIQNGHKVILSTHSPVVLEMAWALRFLQQGQATAADVAKLFEVEPSADLLPLFERALTADTKVYYFDRRPEDGRVHARDISSLDAESDDPGIAGWGGLTDFVSRAGAVVSQVMARSL